MSEFKIPSHWPDANGVFWDRVIASIEDGHMPDSFCGKEGFPERPGDIERKARSDGAFAGQLEAAKLLGAHALIAQCVEIGDRYGLRDGQRKAMIDTRMKIAALWNPAACNPKTVIEQTTTHNYKLERDKYIEAALAVDFSGIMTPEKAAADFDVNYHTNPEKFAIN